MLHSTQSDCFSSLINSNSNNKELWNFTDKLLNWPILSLPVSSPKYSADQLCSYFADKIKTPFEICIRRFKSYFSSWSLPPIFSSFKLVSHDEIKQLILSSLKCICLSNLVPFHLLSHFTNTSAPKISHVVNLSFSSGVFPNTQKLLS